jgi:ElaB/YqjD/DUF883 family membrane-anchored ribosome-binding protein
VDEVKKKEGEIMSDLKILRAKRKELFQEIGECHAEEQEDLKEQITTQEAIEKVRNEIREGGTELSFEEYEILESRQRWLQDHAIN